MPVQDKFEGPIAYNPAGGTDGAGALVPSAEFQVFDVADSSFSTPLPVFDPATGVTISPLRSSAVGVLPDFQVAGARREVLVRSGSFVTRLTSKYGVVFEAGLDPETVQAAIAAGTAAETARAAAVAAKTGAEAAAAEVAGVVATNDGIMKAVAENPESAFSIELSRTIGQVAPRAGIPISQFLLPGESLDPTGVADMSVIAQRAITNVATSFGPVVIIWPEGTFRIQTQLIARSAVGIRGAGRERTCFTTWANQNFIYGNVQSGSSWDGTFLDDLLFEDFTVDCSGQTFTGYTSAIKAFYMQNLRRARWRNVRAIGSWASMYGVDFCIDTVFEDCVGLNSGRGGPTDPIGTGAVYAFGVGRHEGESITLINCDAYGAGSSAVFFERLDARGATRQDGVFRIIGGKASGCAVGVIDCGAGGVEAIGYLIEGFTNAGWFIGPGGQSQVGGIKGHIDATTIIRKGVATGGGSIRGGHGVVVSGTNAAGGYLIEARIEDNAGAGIYLMPGYSLSEGGLTIDRARIRNCAGGGVVASGGTKVETGVRITRNSIRGCGVGIDLRSGFNGVRVENNDLTSASGNQDTAIRFDPVYTVDYASIQGNTTIDTPTLITGDTGLTNKTVAGNRQLTSSPVDPGLLVFDTLKGPDVTGLASSWTLLAGTGWNNVAWVRNTTGARPTITSGAPVSGWYRDCGAHGVRVQAKVMPSTDTNRRRGVMHSVDPATGNAVWAETDNGSGFYRVANRVSGTFSTVFTTTIPASDSHIVGLERDAGTNTFRLLIDGISVWSGTVTGVAESNYAGIIGAADGYARISDFAIWSLT